MLMLGCLPLIGGCTRFDLLNATVPCWGYHSESGIAYGALPRQKLDVYRPKSDAAPKGIVIFFYGGDWQTGQRADYRFVAQALCSEGFIAVLPDYRLFPEVTFPTFVEDGARAVRWAYNNAASIGGDVDHIYLMGHSAGAHIAVLLTLDEHYLRDVGLNRSAIRATVGLSGPYDFNPSDEDSGVFSMQAGQSRPVDDAEPIEFADGRAPPMLLIQGLQDTTVEPGNATRLGERIRANGGEVNTVFYKSRAHVGVVLALASPFRWLAPVLRDSTDFFKSHR